MQVPIVTTITGGLANLEAVRSLKESSVEMIPLQDFIKKAKLDADEAKALN
jgi:carbamoyl-phosphate synthase large subunit